MGAKKGSVPFYSITILMTSKEELGAIKLVAKNTNAIFYDKRSKKSDFIRLLDNILRLT